MKYQLLFKLKGQGAIVLLVAAALATGAITTYGMPNFKAPKLS